MLRVILRLFRHRLRRANPCTTLLVVAFVASVAFLISAILKTFDQHRSPMTVTHHHDDLNGNDGSQLVTTNDKSSGRKHRSSKTKTKNRKDGTQVMESDFIVVGDDEIQTCQMTPRWTRSGRNSTIDHDQRVVSGGVPPLSSTSYSRRYDLVACGIDDSRSSPTETDDLFYVDRRDGSIRVSPTWWQRRLGTVSEPLGCEYRTVTRRGASSEHYDFSQPRELLVRSPLDGARSAEMIDIGQHEFVYIACRVIRSKQSTLDSKSRDQPPTKSVPAHPAARRRQPATSNDEGEHDQVVDIESITKKQLPKSDRKSRHNYLPRLIGSVGLPDPVVLPLGSAEVADKQKKYATTLPQSKWIDRGNHTANNLHGMNTEEDTITSFKKTKAKSDDGSHQNATVYEQFIVRILPVPDFIRRQASAAKSSDDQLNVLVLALSGVSEGGNGDWERRLPRSSRLLKDQLHGVSLSGFNLLGDTIASNILPMLTGRLLGDDEVSSMRVNGDEASYADRLPFVWNRFEQLGYATLYAESVAAGVFQTDFHGFKEQPVHHYMRPFWQAVEVFRSGRVSRDSVSAHQPRQQCFREPQVKHRVLLRYVSDFFLNDAYRNAVPKFAFALVNNFYDEQVERAFVNTGNSSRTSSSSTSSSNGDLDLELARFLDLLVRSEEFRQRTVVIVVSADQASDGLAASVGGDVNESQVGLPMALVVLPELFQRSDSTNAMSSPKSKRHQPKKDWSQLVLNLKRNVDRLTTPLDVHATLLTLMDVNKLLVKDDGRSEFTGKHSAAVSFCADVPLKRTCQSAAVDPHWCTCTYIERADVTDNTVVKAAEWVMERINERLKPVLNRCRRLVIGRLLSAVYEIPNDVLINKENKFYFNRLLPFNFTVKHPTIKRYIRVVIATTDAMSSKGFTLEATVSFTPATLQFQSASRNSDFVRRVISHTNGDQLHQEWQQQQQQPAGCLDESQPELHQFCICT